MDTNKIKALELYKKDLETLRNRAEAKLKKSMINHDNKIRTLLEEYPTVRDVEDAYGYGAITSNKRDKLMELHDNFSTASKYKNPLNDYIQMISLDIKEINLELSKGE